MAPEFGFDSKHLSVSSSDSLSSDDEILRARNAFEALGFEEAQPELRRDMCSDTAFRALPADDLHSLMEVEKAQPKVLRGSLDLIKSLPQRRSIVCDEKPSKANFIEAVDAPPRSGRLDAVTDPLRKSVDETTTSGVSDAVVPATPSTPAAEVWPPDEGWHFKPASFWFRGKRYPINEIGTRLLQQFLRSGDVPIPQDELVRVGWPDSAVGDDALRAQVKQLRKVLRDVAKDNEIEVKDPLPYVRKAKSWCFVLPTR